MTHWRPRLDSIDHAILAHLEEFGPYRPLKYRDLADIKATRDLPRADVEARIEILIEAGLIRRADYFLLAEQAAGLASDTVPLGNGTVVIRADASPDVPSPAESVAA
jgi:DNA-binding Lrp family transcriptional regulator